MEGRVENEVDVVILGSGLASLCLARLLSLEVPGASVLSVDPAAGIARKVGESTVEIGAHFLTERLRLAELITSTQLPKNGLRFWFDDEEHSLTWAESSEDGPGAYSYWRSVQIERETFERGLLELNRAAGVEHLFGARTIEPLLGEDGALHRVRFEHEGRAREVRARWLVDASGVRSLLGRAVENLEPEERISHSACWTWFRGARRIDEFVENSLTRFSFGPRCISTNLLLNDGYWIWLIPLASGLLSVGLGYDHTRLRNAPKNRDELVAFLRSHRKLEQLLAGATPLEFGVLKNFSYRPRRYLRADRVAWIGLAAGFVDPFFANGIDLIALGCESVADLVRRERAGEGLDLERLALYERTLELVYEHFVLSVADLFHTFVSRELSFVRYRRDVHVYWDVYAWAYLAGRMFDKDFLPGLHALAVESQRRTRFFTDLLRHARDSLAARGLLTRDNRGRHTFNQLGFRGTPYVRFEQQLSHPPDLARCRRALEEIDVGCFLALCDVLFDADRSPVRRLLFETVDAVFEQLLDLHARAGGFGDGFWREAFPLLTASLRDRLASGGIAVEPPALGPETYPRLLPELLARIDDPAQQREVRRWFNQAPRLTDFTDLPPEGAHNPPWSVEHTPWLDAPPEFRSVYDILGTEWWNNPKTPFSALGKLARRPSA
ncbi:MAG: NAD(P)/FAD-dependent oxidoreductase [Planctomycetota bacterium]|nr:MAG: NAD(P)/FAD-dependent oxidoreductase [Planctomycetota bacterium]